MLVELLEQPVDTPLLSMLHEVPETQAPDGQPVVASVRQIPWADIGVTPGTPVRVALESKAYFDACLAGSNDKLADCVMAMTTNTAVAGPTCPCRGVPGAQDGQCMAP